MELRNAKNHRLTLPFACASNPHQSHGILADLGELPNATAAPLATFQASGDTRDYIQPQIDNS
jgi:hypothetical protein